MKCILGHSVLGEFEKSAFNFTRTANEALKITNLPYVAHSLWASSIPRPWFQLCWGWRLRACSCKFNRASNDHVNNIFTGLLVPRS